MGITIRALVFLVVAVMMGLSATHAEDNETPDPASAIAAVISEDSRLGAARNEATRTRPIAQVIEDYVASLDAIDLRHCPEDFATAMRRHVDAWRDSIHFFDQFGDLRGEFHEVFEIIREQGESAHEGLVQAESRIWSTWAEVENAMENSRK